MRLRQRQQAGFTLVEIAVVLVIIGLIIAGVLTAQQVTQNAKITNTVQSIKSYQAAVQSYNQNYGALPGDDSKAPGRFPSAAIPVIATGGDDGSLAGSYNTTAESPGESQRFWQDLRAATLIKGAATSAALPGNSFGGVFGVQSTGTFTDGLPNGTNVVCLDKVPGSAANAIDLQLDDGAPDTGTVRGGVAIGGTVATPTYDANALYVLCTPL